MKKEKMPLETLEVYGKLFEFESIDPVKDKKKEFEKPKITEDKKLYVRVMDEETIEEVTTKKQFNAFIKGVKNVRFGYNLGEPDVVFLLFYSLPIDYQEKGKNLIY